MLLLTDVRQQTQEIPNHPSELVRADSSPHLPSLTTSPIEKRDLDEDGESTDEGDSLPLPTLRTRSSRSRSESLSRPMSSQPRPPPRRLGMLGGAHRSRVADGSSVRQSTKSPSPVNIVAQLPLVSHHDPSQTSLFNENIDPVKVSPKKRRIGVIGGRGGSSQVSSQMLRETTPALIMGSNTQRLGQPSSTVESQQTMSSPPTAVVPDQFKHEEAMEAARHVRETSVERANKKREELKQQLQTKGPMRKKRRF